MSDQPILHCDDELRRELVRASCFNGIDYVEIANAEQTKLRVYLFHPIVKASPEQRAAQKLQLGLTEANIQIEGGERTSDIQVTGLRVEPEKADCLCISVDRAGDFSTYVLRLVQVENGRATDKPLKGFDPRYAQVEFSFKADCPSTLDCKPELVCPPKPREQPEINYLAKDYASFRQLILDRLALIMPDWKERHVPDVGIALVEVLAYVGDHLSYYQDAVATEAYLDTARQRISVRRHARLVDYHLHEGCNARAWLTVETSQDVVAGKLKLRDLYFAAGSEDAMAEIFEPLAHDLDAPLSLRVVHNTIHFYTWGDQRCCIPRGATSATLKDEWVELQQTEPEEQPLQKSRPNQKQQANKSSPKPSHRDRKLHLQAGDVLIFEEVKGPRTGAEADADGSHRHAVRLTHVTRRVDSLNDQPVVEIKWAFADALPFPLCLSARRPPPDCDLINCISVARGNVLLVDHGRTIDEPDLGQVGKKTAVGECACEGSVIELSYLPEVFRPVLKKSPLTFSQPLPANPMTPATRLVKQDPHKAIAQIVSLVGLPGICAKPCNQTEPKLIEGIDANDSKWRWYVRSDLLASYADDPHFVVEMDNDRRAHLRFGDGELGQMPEACTIFSAKYRVGNGPAGNVGADTITTAAWRNQTVSGLTLKPRNPLPAQDGRKPETIAEAKLFAPGAFRREIQRAIIADDYARIVEREFKAQVQRAGGALCWTGSWYAAQVTADPLGREDPGRDFRKQIKRRLHRYRRVGHDVEVPQTRYVPLAIEMKVCVLPDYLRGHVETALLALFSHQRLQDGRLGLFHPDNLTFGEGVYFSKLIAAAQAVTGVESVRITKLERMGEGDQGELANGLLPLGPLEIARLDNDPSFPEHGTFKLTMGGGR